MITLIDNNKVYNLVEELFISNYILLKFENNKSVGIDKEDIKKWIEKMEKVNAIS